MERSAQTFAQIAKSRGLPVAGAGDDLGIEVAVAKAEPDRRLVWGWISVVSKNGVPITDTQGDIIDPVDLEQAAHDYQRTSRIGKRQHAGLPVTEYVEGIVFTKAKQDALGIDLGQEGWFGGFYVHDDETWAAAKAGKIPSFSIGGRGTRVKVES